MLYLSLLSSNIEGCKCVYSAIYCCLEKALNFYLLYRSAQIDFWLHFCDLLSCTENSQFTREGSTFDVTVRLPALPSCALWIHVLALLVCKQTPDALTRLDKSTSCPLLCQLG